MAEMLAKPSLFNLNTQKTLKENGKTGAGNLTAT
jgi:hypothetical protein